MVAHKLPFIKRYQCVFTKLASSDGWGRMQIVVSKSSARLLRRVVVLTEIDG